MANLKEISKLIPLMLSKKVKRKKEMTKRIIVKKYLLIS
jgi:hypothetical protein